MIWEIDPTWLVQGRWESWLGQKAQQGLKGCVPVLQRKVSDSKGGNQEAGAFLTDQVVSSLPQMNRAPVPDIQVFGYLLHTHLAGRALQAVQYR